MGIQRLNHAVLYVRDAQKSSEFYCGVLDFREVSNLGGRAIFLQARDSTNDHDLGLFTLGSGAGDSGAGQASVGLYHLAWEVDTLSELQRISERLQQVGALSGASDHGTTKALYARDPDGLEFEVSWLVPADLLHLEPGGMKTERLNLQATIEKFGEQTLGGAGVSH
ncbi:MAG: VOC family protein [Actinomycetia bacterium]|nr:VOC family protein [Actinomycetes bacterium]